MSNDHTTSATTVAPDSALGSSGLADFEAGRYLPELDELEVSETQKLELLGTLWSIMRSFVELGFDVKICEQIFECCGVSAFDSSDALQSPDRINKEFEVAGGGEEGRG
jgi:hypothetical protein